MYPYRKTMKKNDDKGRIDFHTTATHYKKHIFFQLATSHKNRIRVVIILPPPYPVRAAI